MSGVKGRHQIVHDCSLLLFYPDLCVLSAPVQFSVETIKQGVSFLAKPWVWGICPEHL